MYQIIQNIEAFAAMIQMTSIPKHHLGPPLSMWMRRVFFGWDTPRRRQQTNDRCFMRMIVSKINRFVGGRIAQDLMIRDALELLLLIQLQEHLASV